jgi:predicted small secreted protein
MKRETLSISRLLQTCVIAAMLGMALTILPACNTMEGAGKDIESAGESIQDAAN